MSSIRFSPLQKTLQSIDRLTLFLFFSVAISVGSFLSTEIWDGDVWWQVGIGRYILNNFSIPRQDYFSIAAFGRPYHDSHWLFQVVLATADHVAGMPGVQLVMMALWSFTLLFSYKAARPWVESTSAIIILFLGAMASSARFTPRPELVTYLMVALFYLLLQQNRCRRWRDILLLGILQAIWSNCHGLFVIGPFMLGCYLAVTMARSKEKSDAEVKNMLKGLLIVSGATLLTPFGTDGWTYALLLFTEAGPNAPPFFRKIVELKSPFSQENLAYPDTYIFAVLGVFFALTTVLAGFRRQLSVERLLITIACGIAAIKGARNIPLFAVAAIPYIAENLGSHLQRFLLPRLVTVGAGAAMLLSSLFPLSGIYYVYLKLPTRFGLGASPSFASTELPGFLRKVHFDGRVYNSNRLGGFCLYNGLLPLTDGRWEVYDLEVLEMAMYAYRNPALWDYVVSHFNIDGLILQHDSNEAAGVIPHLVQGHAWKLVFYDHTTSFWIRTDGPWSSLPGVATDRYAASILPMRRIEDCLITARFFSLLGKDDVALIFLEKAMRFGERREYILEQKARLELQSGLILPARTTLNQLLKINPRNRFALSVMDREHHQQ
ncbi:MAG: hypothetical protein HYS23_14665 [Geobacter sp.]|nr:hypothetical protein [Geobacter sp.]